MQRSARNDGGKIQSGNRKDRTDSGLFLKLAFFFLLACGVLLWLEWLGSEREMEVIEESIPVPGRVEAE